MIVPYLDAERALNNAGHLRGSYLYIDANEYGITRVIFEYYAVTQLWSTCRESKSHPLVQGNNM